MSASCCGERVSARPCVLDERGVHKAYPGYLAVKRIGRVWPCGVWRVRVCAAMMF